MPRPIKTTTVTDFTGGLNLALDQFTLASNEVPDMLNLVIHRRGGVSTRRGWGRWFEDAYETGKANRMHSMLLSTGTRQVLVAAGGAVYKAANPYVDTTIPADASPHGASFATWLDRCYMATGKANQGYKWDGTTDTALTASASGAWQNDLDSPTGTHMPMAEFCIAHADRLWVAYTSEDATDYPYRVRYSHYNAPESWEEEGYIDLPRGGGAITGLEVFEDYLLVFKEGQVWAITGYEKEAFLPIMLTDAIGAVNQQCIAKSEERLWFFSWPEGVFEWDGKKFTDRFENLRPMVEEGWVDGGQLANAHLGFVDRKLWVSLPFDRSGGATDATVSFVYDPMLGREGAWSLHSGVDSLAPGPFVEFVDSSGVRLPLGAHPTEDTILQLDQRSDAMDDLDGTPVEFETYIQLRWMETPIVGQRAQWRRPDYILKDAEAEYDLTVDVFHDYDESAAARQHTLSLSPGGGSLIWGSGSWGEEWGGTVAGAVKARGGMLGNAYAVQLRPQTASGVAWGLDAVVYKYTPRRVR